jgi:hypothetical protein
MKRRLLLVLLFLFMMAGVLDYGFAEESHAKPKRTGFYAKVDLNYLLHADSLYKDIYGSGTLFPRLSLGYNLNRFNFWLGYGFFSTDGLIPDTPFEASSKQSYLSLGIGFRGPMSDKLSYVFGFQMVRISYKEEALDVVVSDSTMGYGLEGILRYNLGRSFFVDVSIGLISGTVILDDGAQAKLGGFRSGLGLGMRF